MTGRDSQPVDRGRADSSLGLQPMPAAVQALVVFGYSPDLVLSTYRQLQSASATHPQHAASVSRSWDDATTGNDLPHSVSAATLLRAVDDAFGDRDASSSGAEGVRSGIATSSGPRLSVGALRGEEGARDNGEAGREPTAEDRSSSMQIGTGNGQQQSMRLLAPDHTQSSADSTSPINNQSSDNAQSFIISAEGASVSETSHLMNPSSSTSSSSLSRTAEGFADSNPETLPSTTVSVTPTSHMNTSTTSVSASSEETPADPGQTRGTVCSTSSAATRDRSLDRGNQEEDQAAEQKATDRRRQLRRLAALKAENRRLKDRQTCCHCRQKPVALTLLPCGHFCLCADCGPTFDECPVCRKTILADVRTFVC